MAKDKNKLYKSDEIYKDLQIPFRYLRRLLTKLTNSGLLTSIQGKFGGYQIKHDLSKIRLYDIINAVEEREEPNECFFGYKTCPLNDKCSMHDKWYDVQKNITSVLKNTSLQTIVDEGDDKILFKEFI